jgi:hypothetical protein
MLPPFARLSLIRTVRPQLEQRVPEGRMDVSKRDAAVFDRVGADHHPVEDGDQYKPANHQQKSKEAQPAFDVRGSPMAGLQQRGEDEVRDDDPHHREREHAVENFSLEPVILVPQADRCVHDSGRRIYRGDEDRDWTNQGKKEEDPRGPLAEAMSNKTLGWSATAHADRRQFSRCGFVTTQLNGGHWNAARVHRIMPTADLRQPSSRRWRGLHPVPANEG